VFNTNIAIEETTRKPPRKLVVLVVDDEIRILRLLQMILKAEGYRVVTAGDAKTAIKTFFSDEESGLVLLDIMLPDMNGIDLCRRIREASRVPIIMVTAKGDEIEKITALGAGADDYITKPFSASELAARARAVLRRTNTWSEKPEPIYQSGDLLIDFTRCRVTLEGRDIELTATEYNLLSYLARSTDRVVTLDQLLEKVWGEAYIGKTHLLQVHIARLRKKLGDDPKKPRYFQTKIGIGYKMSISVT
jgi:DNA-binding response OmpR family regulator